MLPNCKQIAEQTSENIDEPLKGTRWLNMKFHMLMCAFCRRYGNQMALSSKSVEYLTQKNKPSEETRINVENCYSELHCQNKPEE